MNPIEPISSSFFPNFHSQDAHIKIEHFIGDQANPEILKLVFDSSNNFYNIFMELFLNDIVPGSGKRYLSKTLIAAEILIIKQTIHDSEYNLNNNDANIYGIIAETLLKTFRFSSSKQTYLNTSEIVSSPTHSGPDLVELIEEDNNLLMIMRDARNNIDDSSIRCAIKNKIEKLASTNWHPTRKKLESCGLDKDQNRNIFAELMAGNIKSQKTIAIISGTDEYTEIIRNESIVTQKIVKTTQEIEEITELAERRKKEKDLAIWNLIKSKGDYSYFYILLIIPDYNNICRKIFTDIKQFPICSD